MLPRTSSGTPHEHFHVGARPCSRVRVLPFQLGVAAKTIHLHGTPILSESGVSVRTSRLAADGCYPHEHRLRDTWAHSRWASLGATFLTFACAKVAVRTFLTTPCGGRGCPAQHEVFLPLIFDNCNVSEISLKLRSAQYILIPIRIVLFICDYTLLFHS